MKIDRTKVPRGASYEGLCLALRPDLSRNLNAAALATFLVEAGPDLVPKRENLNYTPEALIKTFPRRRITVAQANALGRIPGRAANQEAIANLIYGNREGNGPPESGDGWRFRGGGWIQLTFRNNYRLYGLEDHPEDILKPEVSAQVSWQFILNTGQTNIQTEVGMRRLSRAVNLGNPNHPAESIHEPLRIQYFKQLQVAISG